MRQEGIATANHDNLTDLLLTNQILHILSCHAIGDYRLDYLMLAHEAHFLFHGLDVHKMIDFEVLLELLQPLKNISALMAVN